MIQVLGSQPLTALAERIRCINNYIDTAGDVSDCLTAPATTTLEVNVTIKVCPSIVDRVDRRCDDVDRRGGLCVDTALDRLLIKGSPSPQPLKID